MKNLSVHFSLVKRALDLSVEKNNVLYGIKQKKKAIQVDVRLN